MATGGTQGFRNDALGPALDAAIGGDARKLYDLLTLLGGLPGPRANAGLVAAFAAECAGRGKRADDRFSRTVRWTANSLS